MISTFVNIENKPSVMMFTGKLMILRIGFKIRNIIASATPAVNKVAAPPSIFTPGIIEGRKKRISV